MHILVVTYDGHRFPVKLDLGSTCSQLIERIWQQQSQALLEGLFRAVGDDDFDALTLLLRRGAAVVPFLFNIAGMNLLKYAQQRRATSCIALLDRLSKDWPAEDAVSLGGGRNPELLWKISYGGVQIPGDFLLEGILHDTAVGVTGGKELTLYLRGIPWARDSYMQGVYSRAVHGFLAKERDNNPDATVEIDRQIRPLPPLLVPDDCSIQEALIHLREGQAIFVREGHYVCSEDVEITKKCYLIGEPGATISGAVRFKPASEGTVRGLRIVSRDLCMSVAGRWIMEDCGFENEYGQAVVVWGGELSMCGCRVGTPGKPGGVTHSNVCVMGDACLRAEHCEFWGGPVTKADDRAYVKLKSCCAYEPGAKPRD